jgi:hypothetical protein
MKQEKHRLRKLMKKNEQGGQNVARREKGAFYHSIARGAERERIFRDDAWRAAGIVAERRRDGNRGFQPAVFDPACMVLATEES